MKHIFAVTSQIHLQQYEMLYANFSQKLDGFLSFLRDHYGVTDLPQAIVWTDYDTATRCISSIPIPAYTNDYRTVFCPELETWKYIYLRQLDSRDHPAIRDYYETKLTSDHILQILGHEFVHHSAFFPDLGYESSIWFEEGMCEYISRKYFLTPDAFQEEARINALLVSLYWEQYGHHSLEEFGAATYSGDYASIFFEYWRSFLAVQKIVELYGGDPISVLNQYQKWYLSSREQSLAQFFHIEA